MCETLREIRKQDEFFSLFARRFFWRSAEAEKREIGIRDLLKINFDFVILFKGLQKELF